MLEVHNTRVGDLAPIEGNARDQFEEHQRFCQ
jgi:hypothetical protein